MRIVQLVNLVTEQSGGIRTALDHLGAGYAAAGHERHVIRPGMTAERRPVAGGSEWVLPGQARASPRRGQEQVLDPREARSDRSSGGTEDELVGRDEGILEPAHAGKPREC